MTLSMRMQTKEIELSQSSIDNGRIYFPITDAKFFPPESYSDRERDGHGGTEVVFLAGSHSFVGPIRVYSGHRLSPQRSFAPFFKEVGAGAGDKLVVKRTADREYKVEHVPAPGGLPLASA
ncbi:MAG: hypothetical protein WA134_16145 [Rhodoferax sp.]|jgi:hypothetical protein